MSITLKTAEGKRATITDEALATLAGELRGTLALPGKPGYDEARTLWNAMVDRRPGLVIRALGTTDIQAAVRFAAKQGVLISIRSGGHQIAGHAVADDAVLLDLSQMRSVHVDAKHRTARVGAGCTLGDVDREAQAHALAVPTGINSTTGIAGLTLGGGFGWITRRWGMTIDNLISAEIVTADGQIRRAAADENADLFWAIRGGGGNFGVVASFEFRLIPIGPEVLSGLIVHPLSEAKHLLQGYRRIADEAPDDLTVWTVMRKAPPLPFLPEEWHGREVLVFAACYSGDMKEGEKAMAPLRALGKPIADVIGPHPFAGWQAAFDPLLTPGARNYWKSHDFKELPDAAIDTLLEAVHALPDPQCEVFIAHVGGAMARVKPDATAYPMRDSHFIMNVHTRWAEHGKDAPCKAWARALFDRMARYSTGSAYVNFMPEDEPDRIASVYGKNFDRLKQVKTKYDPKNLFRLNHNIWPEMAVQAAE